jgi:hypothetical protein
MIVIKQQNLRVLLFPSYSNRCIVLLILGMLLGTEVGAQLAQFDFPATNSLEVSSKNDNVSVSIVSLSSGTITTNIATGTEFPNEPYVQATGWNATTQASAKSFQFTINAATGYTFTITNISFNALSVGTTGPTAVGFAINAANVYSTNAPSASLLSVNEPVVEHSNLTSATIKIQAWLNGSRASTGAGSFRLDDVVITGFVTANCEFPTTQISSLSFTDISNSQQTLSFIRGNGTGGVLAIAKAGSAPTDPVSGTNYVASQNFGFGDLVGGGSAVCNDVASGSLVQTAQTVSGLMSETNYFYNLYEWNASGICFNLSEIKGNAWTLSTTPGAQPSSFSAVAIGNSQIDLLFPAPGSVGSTDGYVILGRADGTAPTTNGIVNGRAISSWTLPQGTSVIADINNLSSTSQSVGSLLSGTTYCYLIIPYNWNGINIETYNYLTAGAPLTACATTRAFFPNGAYRTNPLFSGIYSFSSTLPDADGNYPWQFWDESWKNATADALSPQALPVKPSVIYLNGANIDFADGGIYNDLEIDGVNTSVRLNNSMTGLTIAPGKTIKIKNGKLDIRGKFDLGDAATIHVFGGGQLAFGSISNNFVRAANSLIEVEDNGKLFVQSYLSDLWTGQEKFHKNSTVVIQSWDNNMLSNLIPFNTSVSRFSDGDISACFGNLVIDMGTSFNDQPMGILPADFDGALTNRDLIFRSAANGGGFGVNLINLSTAGNTITIGRNLLIENSWSKSISILALGGTAMVNVKGNLQHESNSSSTFKLCQTNIIGTAVTLQIDGDLRVANNAVFDFNSLASGTELVNATVNLKGDLTVESGAAIHTTYTASNGILNFTGAGDGSAPSLTQSINVSSTNSLRNRRINFVVSPSVVGTNYVQLTRNLELGTASTFTIKSDALFDFGFTDNEANNITMVAGAASVRFASETRSILKITSPDGIIKNNSYGTAVGNVQGISQTNRSFNNVATFWYTGKRNQTTGDGLSTTTGGAPLSTANGKVVIVDLADNSVSLTPTIPLGFSNNIDVSATGGKLDIRKGQFIETTTASIFAATGFTGGTLYMAPGTLYKVVVGSNTAAGSAASLIPRMDGTKFSYDIQGTIELAGQGVNAFQTLRGLRKYRAVRFTGVNTLGIDYKNLSNTVTIDSALIITHSIVDCIDASGLAIPFVGTGALTMTGGRLRIKALNNASPALDGSYVGATYSLTGGTIEFYGSKATEQQQIRGNYKGGASVISYNNVEINADAGNYSTVVDKAGNVDLNSSFIVHGIMNVNSPAVLRMDKEESIGGSGTFNLNNGAGLLYGGTTGTAGSSIEGLEASGTGIDAGHIRTSQRHFSPQAHYGFVSPGNMSTGTGLPNTVAGLGLYKSATTDQVALTNAVTISTEGILNLVRGQLITTKAKPLILQSPVDITPNSGNNSFINGPSTWYTSGSGSLIFPVGKNQQASHFTFNATANFGDGFTGEYFAETVPEGILLGPGLGAIIDKGYWQLERQGSFGTKGIITLNYKNPGLDHWTLGNGSTAANPTAANLIRVVQKKSESAPEPWNFTFTSSAVGQSTGHDVDAALSSEELPSFGYFTFGYTSLTILASNQVDFTVRNLNHNALLNWKLDSAGSIASFKILHSSDGVFFTAVATLASTGQVSYGYTVPNLPRGSHYFKLQLISANGLKYDSQIQSIQVKSSFTEIIGLVNSVTRTQLFANVFSVSDQLISVVISNMDGKVVDVQTAKLSVGSNKLSVNLPNLSAGLYAVQLTTADRATRTLKFLVE